MEINKLIDHTLLKPDALLGDFTQAFRDALHYQFKAICVNSGFVPLMSHLMFRGPEENPILLCSTVGFPLGNSSIDSKLLEINQGFKLGVSEFDVVPLLSAIKSQDWDHFEKEISQLREASAGRTLKVILEVALLTDDEIKRCCDICVEQEVNFVKTSTGFSRKLEPIETAKYVKLMKDCVKGSPVLVKASGGIKTLRDLELMLEAEADRIGTSNGVKIMEEVRNAK